MEDIKMNIKFKNRFKRVVSSIMAAGMALSLIPSVSFAAQSNEYVDPADVWIEANGRTSEFDINATVLRVLCTALYAICRQAIFLIAFPNIRVQAKHH